MELIYDQIIKIVIATILGGLVGWERQIKHRPAGLRTHMLVCLSATLIAVISLAKFPEDSARIMAGIITGIGFIGAGNIIAQGTEGIHGVTTAASIWAVSALGIAIGLGFILLSTITTALIILILFLSKLESKMDRNKQEKAKLSK